MNTRLQVEHPVSEEVTGIDLVREQFRLAEGGVLDYADPVTTGHSIEFRINGEDPGRNFLPAPGPVHQLRFPGGPGIRIDSGVTSGDEISGAFDSLLAKLIVTGATRKDALERARRALDEFEVAGLPTVLPFHRDIVRNPAFAPDGDEPFSIYTRWIETEYDNQLEPWSGELDDDAGRRRAHERRRRGRRSPRRGHAFRSGSSAAGCDSASRTAAPHPDAAPRRTRSTPARGDAVKAPMQATIVKVAVAEGDKVVKGDLVLVLEAMKMEQPIVAHKDGVVGTVNAEAGATVSSGHLLLAIVDA